MNANSQPAWMRTVLTLAGVYNLVWGAFAIVFPLAMFRWVGMEPPVYPELWQCIGMIVGVYGVGYLIAARNPFVHWPIILVGLLGKVFGPIGFGWAMLSGRLPAMFGATILTNDLIWWAPFLAILWGAFRFHTEPREAAPEHIDRSMQPSAMSTLRGDTGMTLADLSEEKSVLVVFLRHAGCAFHRQALADLRHAREQLSAEGVQIAVVHMSKGENPCDRKPEYGLSEVVHFSDPSCQLYREFGLERGTFTQLLGLRVWIMGLFAVLQGHRVGKLMGDSFQMPGVFLVKEGRVINQFRHETAGDRPDYVEISRSYVS